MSFSYLMQCLSLRAGFRYVIGAVALCLKFHAVAENIVHVGLFLTLDDEK